MSPYRLVPHTSEVGLRITGRTWKEFYRSAARGLLAVCGAGSLRGGAGRRRSVALRADTPEELLVVWLNELNYLLSAKRLKPLDVEFHEAGPDRIDARLALEPGARLEREVKSASFYRLRVRRARGALGATVVLDV